MLALLYRATLGANSVYIVATSRSGAEEQAEEYYQYVDHPSIEYLGRVANLSLGTEEEGSEVEAWQPIAELKEIVSDPSG